MFFRKLLDINNPTLSTKLPTFVAKRDVVATIPDLYENFARIMHPVLWRTNISRVHVFRIRITLKLIK